MGLLKKIGLRRRKVRPVGQNLEKGRDDGRKQKRKDVAVKASIFVGLLAITLAAFPRGEVYRYAVQVGDEWQGEPLVAPFDFAILKDAGTIAEERRQVRLTTPPIFERIPGAKEKMRANRDTVQAQLERIFEAYAGFLEKKSRGRLVEAIDDSLRYMSLRRNARLKLTESQWQRLIDAYVARVPGLSTASRTPRRGPRLDEALLDEAYSFGRQMLSLGVLDVSIDSILTDEIVVRDLRQHTSQRKDKQSVFGLNEAHTSAREFFERNHPDDMELARLADAFFRAIFQPSLRYMRAETLREWQRKEANISPTRGIVRQGEVIVDSGERVTPEIRRKILSLERAQDERGGGTVGWKITLGQLMLTFATYGLFFLYLFILRRKIFEDNRHVFLIALLFAGIIGLYAIALRLPVVVMYAVPVIIVSLVLTILFDSRVSFFATLALAFIGSHLLRYDFEFTFATMIAGALGIFSVRDIKNRGQFFLSAGVVFLGYLWVLGASWLLSRTSFDRFMWDTLMVGVNSFLLIMALPLLWVFERAFKITTDLTLLELSDTNRPLLKELSVRAPGTFNHSLQVANLAEAAADAIGANALLTRVGALYHDIGKMLKPEYFVENQRPGENPHDGLKPRMSALIIASHVKEGLEIGRQYKLPQVVLDFIPMHHGTTRIEYFYRRALEQAKEGDPPVQESEFRYPGPRPNTKETTILMLADSVEAASRTLANPTHKRLESLIDMIISARREDGQFEDSDLTFRDLTKIKETFLAMLLAIYHVRVKYPGQAEKEESEKEAEALPEGGGGRLLSPPEAGGEAGKASAETSGETAAGAKGAPDGTEARAPVIFDAESPGEAAPAENGGMKTSAEPKGEAGG
jgi:putative nucleotidyltransferase with HDIG domain